MRKNVFWATVVAATIVGAGLRLAAQEPSEGKVGRYQLAATGPAVILLDTATGHVWSRNFQGEWRDEGNPTRTPPRSTGVVAKKAQPSLRLPSRSVEMLLTQRESRPIPGSDGTVRVRLGDVTDGQAFLEVVTDDKPLLERTSVRPGDAPEFTLDDKKYAVRVTELRNILVGDDFAKVMIEEVAPTPEPPPKRKARRKKAEGKDPPGKSAGDVPVPKSPAK